MVYGTQMIWLLLNGKKVAGNDITNAVMSGYLMIRERDVSGRKSSKAIKPTRRWMVLRADYVVYCYNDKGDAKALSGLPLPGNVVLHGPDDLADDDLVRKEDLGQVIKVAQQNFQNRTVKRVYYFQANNPELASK